MACSAQHADLVKSAEDAHTYLVHDNADPLQASLSGLLLEGLPPMGSSVLAPRAGVPPLFLHIPTIGRGVGLATGESAVLGLCQA